MHRNRLRLIIAVALAAVALAAVVSYERQSANAALQGDVEDDLNLFAVGEPDTGDGPLTVHFSVESLVVDKMEDPDYLWDFGDGSEPSTEASPTHTYERPGQFIATVKTIDASGETGMDDVWVQVD